MIIELGNIYSTVRGNPAELRWLDDTLSVVEKHYSPYSKSMVVEPRHFLTENQFRTGLLNYILDEGGNDADFEIRDLRKAPIEYKGAVPMLLPDSEKGTIELWEDQLNSARCLVDNQRAIIELPGGVGKTEVAIAAMKALPLVRFLILVNTTELQKQWIKRLENRGVQVSDIGIVNPTHWNSQKITVAMAPTLQARVDKEETLDFLNTFQGVIVDECHIDTFEEILLNMKNARYRWGLSATALEYGKGRNLKLIGLLGGLAYKADVEDMIDLGAIADLTYHFLPCPLEGIYAEEMHTIVEAISDFRDWYDYFLYQNPFVRNLIWRVADIKRNSQLLVIVNEIEHGEYLREGIPESVFVHGKLARVKREDLVEGFKNGRYQTLITSPILDFGVDLPQLRNIFLAAGMESPTRFLQRMYRGSRRKEVDNMLHLYDLDFGQLNYLGDHSQSRLKTLKRKCPNLKISRTL
jgi:superfamily II DNA or RNA helicase